MEVNDIKTGLNAEIEIRANGKEASFTTEILDNSDGVCKLALVRKDDCIVKFDTSYSLFRLTVYFPGECPYCWNVKGLPIVKIDNGVYCYGVIFDKKDGTKVNRRGAFRVGLSVVAEAQISGHTKVRKCYLKDLSYSGFAITTKEKQDIQVGESVKVSFSYRGEVYTMIGNITRQEDLTEDIRLYGCSLGVTTTKLQSLIADIQRERLKKERKR